METVLMGFAFGESLGTGQRPQPKFVGLFQGYIQECAGQMRSLVPISRGKSREQFERVVHIVDRVDMKSALFAPASTRSSRSIKSPTLARGTTTPWSPVKPKCRHTSKKPSIFSLTPPMACTLPC